MHPYRTTVSITRGAQFTRATRNGPSYIESCSQAEVDHVIGYRVDTTCSWLIRGRPHRFSMLIIRNLG